MYKSGNNNTKFDQRAIERLEQSLMTIKALYDGSLLEVSVFGSYARGANGKYSSIDLLIIVKESSKRFLQRNANLQRLLNESEKIPQIDPLVYTEEELLSLIDKKESFILSILQESVLVWSTKPYKSLNEILLDKPTHSIYRYQLPDLKECEV